MSTTSQREAAFRPEIEGLRAVAATLVAVFHIWFGRVSGGVDVFFVVSSFLITTGLLGQVERTGTVDFARFWGRLIRRLLPAALFVLFVVIVASVLWQSKSRWRDTIEHVAASAVYLENWKLSLDAVDYLAQNSPPPPVQHYWALSVQGQFYFIWPFVFFATAWVARRTGVAFRGMLVPALLLIFAVSIAFSVYITHVDQPRAYFNTFARAWEFCIGALLAVLISKVTLPNAVRLPMGWIGLLAILSCGFLFQVSRVFPGYAALWPTLGGALVIITGTTRGFGVDKLLASRPMVYLGGISYGIYLWHFPILSFCRAYAEPDSIGIVQGLCIIGASIVLAGLTTRFIEMPLRGIKAKSDKPWHSFALGAALLVPVVISLAVWTLHYRELRHEARDRAHAARSSHPGAQAMEPGFVAPASYGKERYPGPLIVYDDREMFADRRCFQRRLGRPYDCVLGAPYGKFVMVVVGGSHSSQWMPVLESIARKKQWKLVHLARANCPFYIGEKVSEAESETCDDWNLDVLEKLLALRPDAVFMTSTREKDGDEYVPKGYVDAWRALSRENIRVVAVRDNPKVTFDAPECVELHGEDEQKCWLVRSEVLEVPNPTDTLEDPPPNVRFIDLSDYFCDATTCKPVIGNVTVYRHLSHITGTFARTMEPMLTRELERVLGLPAS